MQGKCVTWLPSYGAEMRGGTAHCMVIISEQPIASPYVEFCDDAILMNTPSVKKFIPKVKARGLVVINKEDLDELAIPKALRIINRDFTKEAVELGNKQIANIIALGAYISGTKILCQSDLEKALEEVFSAKGSQMLRLNKAALQRGIKLGIR
jgi:2-oxoglutarate ferredoxin oxidoreductase subunit gamma